MNLQVVFENEHFVVLDKEPMVLTTPSREGAEDVRPCLGAELQRQRQIQIFPVHRLDFEVSGLVLFAKNPKAHAIANRWFEHKQVFKTYFALSEGPSFAHIPPQIKNPRILQTPVSNESFLWESKLLRGKKRSYEHASGKHSETRATYLGTFSTAPAGTLWHRWELQPLTGRPHQLRFELSRHGFPIVGDAVYGAAGNFTQPGIALRAVRIDFSKAPEASSLQLPPTLEVAAKGI